MKVNEGMEKIYQLHQSQFNLMERFMCHYISYKEIYSRREELMSGSKFWAQTCTAHVCEAVIIWCKLFGTRGDETHWKKFIQDKSEQEKFKGILWEKLNFSEDNWTDYVEAMRKLRGKCIAHTELAFDRSSIIPELFPADNVINLPELDTAVKVVKFYDEWARIKRYGEFYAFHHEVPRVEDVVKDYAEETQRVLKIYINNAVNTSPEK